MIWLKSAIFLILALVVAFVLTLFYLGHQSVNGAPGGLIDGRLQPCPVSPNCVSSEGGEDQRHRIDALRLPTGEPQPSMQALKSTVLAMGGSIVSVSDDYLAAIFRSDVFGFVDDLELRRDPGRDVYQVRSASRVGHGDLDANRQRVEQLRELLGSR